MRPRQRLAVLALRSSGLPQLRWLSISPSSRTSITARTRSSTAWCDRPAPSGLTRRSSGSRPRGGSRSSRRSGTPPTTSVSRWLRRPYACGRSRWRRQSAPDPDAAGRSEGGGT